MEKERAASLEFAFKEMFDLLEEENRHMSPLERHRFIGPGLRGGKRSVFLAAAQFVLLPSSWNSVVTGYAPPLSVVSGF